MDGHEDGGAGLRDQPENQGHCSLENQSKSRRRQYLSRMNSVNIFASDCVPIRMRSVVMNSWTGALSSRSRMMVKSLRGNCRRQNEPSPSSDVPVPSQYLRVLENLRLVTCTSLIV